MQQPLASIPSPSQGAVHLGPLPLRGYALMIIIGVVVAVWLGERRWTARGGASGTVVDIAVWAVPFGLLGGRLYHVITDYQLYFGHGKNPIDALKVWNGGLGIWGAIAMGALGAYLGCRSRGVSLRAFADATAPGIALAQAIGRWGNWFNQELYGRPSTLPWAVRIDPAHRPLKTQDIATYQPTFLYESLWCVGVAVLVIWAEKRFRLAYGRTFALYVAAYTVGRAWIEWLRVDEAHLILGLRLNDWTSLIVFLCAVAYLYHYRDRTEFPAEALGTATPEGGAAGDAAATGTEPSGDDEADSKADSKADTGGSESDPGGDGTPADATGSDAPEAATPEIAECTAADADAGQEDAAPDREDAEQTTEPDAAESGPTAEVETAEPAQVGPDEPAESGPVEPQRSTVMLDGGAGEVGVDGKEKATAGPEPDQATS